MAEAAGAPPPKLVHIPTALLAQLEPERSGIIQHNFWGNNIFDNSAARRDLGFAYTIPWLEGARRTIAWLDAHDQVLDCSVAPWIDRMIAAWEATTAYMRKEYLA